MFTMFSCIVVYNVVKSERGSYNRTRHHNPIKVVFKPISTLQLVYLFSISLLSSFPPLSLRLNLCEKSLNSLTPSPVTP